MKKQSGDPRHTQQWKFHLVPLPIHPIIKSCWLSGPLHCITCGLISKNDTCGRWENLNDVYKWLRVLNGLKDCKSHTWLLPWAKLEGISWTWEKGRVFISHEIVVIWTQGLTIHSHKYNFQDCMLHNKISSTTSHTYIDYRLTWSSQHADMSQWHMWDYECSSTSCNYQASLLDNN